MRRPPPEGTSVSQEPSLVAEHFTDKPQSKFVLSFGIILAEWEGVHLLFLILGAMFSLLRSAVSWTVTS